MVRGVHADRLRTVVFRYVHRPAQTHFEAGTGATATAEEVDNDLFILRVEAKCVLGLEVEWRLFHGCHHDTAFGVSFGCKQRLSAWQVRSSSWACKIKMACFFM